MALDSATKAFQLFLSHVAVAVSPCRNAVSPRVPVSTMGRSSLPSVSATSRRRAWFFSSRACRVLLAASNSRCTLVASLNARVACSCVVLTSWMLLASEVMTFVTPAPVSCRSPRMGASLSMPPSCSAARANSSRAALASCLTSAVNFCTSSPTAAASRAGSL